MQKLIDDLYAHFESIPSRTQEEQSIPDRLRGNYPIVFRHRDDLEQKGFNTRLITEEQMRQLAKQMQEDYCKIDYWDDLSNAAYDLKLPRCPTCPACNSIHTLFSEQNEVFSCEICGQTWSESYTLVDNPEEVDRLPDDLGYPCCESQNSNARYIPEYDYIRIFGEDPEPNSYFEPVCWPESQKYMPDVKDDGDSAGDSNQLLNELINDEKGIADFGPSAMWVPFCNLKK